MPPGFVVTTEMCQAFFKAGKTLPPGLKEEYTEALAKASGGPRRWGLVWGLMSVVGPIVPPPPMYLTH